jgi:hypothetical protein
MPKGDKRRKNNKTKNTGGKFDVPTPDPIVNTHLGVIEKAHGNSPPSFTIKTATCEYLGIMRNGAKFRRAKIGDWVLIERHDEGGLKMISKCGKGVERVTILHLYSNEQHGYIREYMKSIDSDNHAIRFDTDIEISDDITELARAQLEGTAKKEDFNEDEYIKNI